MNQNPNFDVNPEETEPQYTIRNDNDATRAIMAGLEWLIRSAAQKTIEEVLTTIIKR